MPRNRTIYSIVSVADSVLYQMKLHKCHGLTEEKLDNSNTVMKTRPKKIFVPLGSSKWSQKLQLN